MNAQKNLKLFYFYSLFLLSVQVNGQRKTSLEDLQINGNVKTCHVITHKLRLGKDTLIQGDLLINEPYKEQKLTFDSSGFCTEKQVYNPDGSLQYLIRRNYDQWHNLTYEERCNEKGEVLSCRKFQLALNEQGFPISCKLLNKDSTVNGTESYELNSFNYRNKLKRYSANGQLEFSFYYTYDEHQRLTEYYETENDTAKKYGATYIFSQNKKSFPEKLYNEKHEFFFKYSYTFNDKGDYTQLFYQTPKGKTKKSWNIEYIYDSRGNWIKAIFKPLKTSIFNSKKNGFITERTLTYF